jgi:hypothetical protein
MSPVAVDVPAEATRRRVLFAVNLVHCRWQGFDVLDVHRDRR